VEFRFRSALPRVDGRRWLAGLLVAGLVGLPQPALAVAAEVGSVTSAQADLSSALAQDGTFTGNDDVNGVVDLTQWALVSNITRGDAPRFQRSSQPAPASGANLWSGVGEYGANGALNGGVSALVVIGSDLYVGGSFTNAGAVPAADHVARWNGTSWAALGSNGAGNGALNSEVEAMAVVGGELYVGGWFTDAAGLPEADHVARWNGTAWSALGSNGAGNGALNARVHAISAAPDGLLVGGNFTNAGGRAEADHIAHWNGTAWGPLGSNGAGNGALSDSVRAIAVAGADIYAGGLFTNAAGVPQADGVARWNGSAWSALGASPAGTNGALLGDVHALVARDGELYVGGSFENAAGLAQADFVARWNGTGWFALGSNGAGGALNGGVGALVFVGTDLYVGGGFTFAGGIAGAHHLARWSGGSWYGVGVTTPHDALNGGVRAIAPSGTSIYIGGHFTDVDDRRPSDYVARWNGSIWSGLGTDGGEDGAVKGDVYAVAVLGGSVYVGGSFGATAGLGRASWIARWDGSRWSALGSNGPNPSLNGSVHSLAVIGSDLYVGGSFTNAGGVAAGDYVARWDGTSWHALGSNGAGDGPLNGTVSSLAASGTTLIVGGGFTNAAGISAADYLARWSGSSWSGLGSNGSGNGALNSSVDAIATDGANVFAGGGFTDVAGVATADHVARWNGTSWSALGSNGAGNGAIGSPGAVVYALAASGSDLYVGGYFENVASLPTADYVARWNGTSWSALGSNGAGDGALKQGPSQAVHALVVSGSEVYVGGWFRDAAGIATADHLVRWNGTSWSAVDGWLHDNGSNPSQAVAALISAGNDMYVGGNFTNAAGVPQADYVARWGGLKPGSVDTSAPVVQAPTQVLIAPQSLGSTVRVRLSWPAAADPSGIARYDLQMSRNAGSWGAVALSPATTTAVDVSLMPGSSYRFRLRARDGAGNIGAWATTTNRTVLLRQELHSSIAFSGSWKRVALAGASGGYVRRSVVANSSATWMFSGSGAAVVSTLGPNRGVAEIWLDGSKVATVDLYAPSRRAAQLVWSGSFQPGSHRLQVRGTGTKAPASTGVRVDVDAFLSYP